MELGKYDAQAICDDLKEIVNHDINYVNSEGIMIASTNRNRIGIHHQAALDSIKSKKKVIITKKDEGDVYLEGINSPVFNEGEVIGVISINGDVSEVDKYVDIITKMTQIYINGLNYQKLKNQTNVEKKRIVENIIYNHDLSNIRNDLMKFDVDVSKGIYVVIYEFTNEVVLNDILKKKSNSVSAIVGNRLISLVAAKGTKNVTEAIYNGKLKDIDDKKYKIGISDNVFTVNMLYQAYKNAYTALNAITGMDSELLFYSNISYELIISKISIEDRREILNKSFYKFNDEQKQEYLNILKTYYECDRSLAKSSEKLFLHKNTILYKLDKVYKITGFNPRNFKDGSFLYLSLLLYEQELYN